VARLITDLVGENHLGTVEELNVLARRRRLLQFAAFYKDVLLPSAKGGRTRILVRPRIVRDYFPRLPTEVALTVAKDVAQMQGFKCDIQISSSHGLPSLVLAWSKPAFESSSVVRPSTAQALRMCSERAWDSHPGWKRLHREVLLPIAREGGQAWRSSPKRLRTQFFSDLNYASVEGLLKRQRIRLLQTSAPIWTLKW